MTIIESNEHFIGRTKSDYIPALRNWLLEKHGAEHAARVDSLLAKNEGAISGAALLGRDALEILRGHLELELTLSAAAK